jgi:3-hydroxyisobutyrate dehydrogenase
MGSIETNSRTLGWIGTGRMGFAMADRLASNGVPLRVWNRTAAKAANLTRKGCVVAEHVSELASCEIVFMILATHHDIEKVLFGEGGLLAGTNTPRIIADITSIGPEDSSNIRKRLADRGIQFISSPVSGNAKVISSGRLSVVVSGPEVAFIEVEPYLRMLGQSVSYVGDAEQARIAKICHNVMLGVVTQNLAEILVLAEKSGLGRHDFLTFLNSSVMGSMFTRYKSPAFCNLDFQVTFTPELMLKDIDLGLSLARTHGVAMPTTVITREQVQALIGNGYSEDFSQLLLLEAAAAGINLTPDPRTIDDGL